MDSSDSNIQQMYHKFHSCNTSFTFVPQLDLYHKVLSEYMGFKKENDLMLQYLSAALVCLEGLLLLASLDPSDAVDSAGLVSLASSSWPLRVLGFPVFFLTIFEVGLTPTSQEETEKKIKISFRSSGPPKHGTVN